MKKQLWMNSKAVYIAIAVLLAVPAVLLIAPGASGSYYNPHGDTERLYAWICHFSYLVIPSIMIYCFVKREERASWVLALELLTAGIVYSQLLHEETDIWLFTKGAAMMLVLALCPLAKGLTKDWKYLTLVYLWSGLYYFAIQWIFPGTSQYTAIFLIAFGGVLVIVMGILPGFLKEPLSRNGWLGVLITMAVSALLLTDGFTVPGWGIYLGVLLVGYAVMAARLWGREYPDCAQ